MTAVVDAVVPLVVGTALVLTAAVLVSTRSPRTALPVLLDLLLVAGLLRLTASQTWEAVAAAAAVVAVRRVASAALRRAADEAARSPA